jgi:hypothetical protein
MSTALLPAGGGVQLNDAGGMGLAFWTYSPLLCAESAGNPASNGNLLLCLARAVAAVPINKLGVNVLTAGVTPGAGVNRMTLFTAAGVLVAQTTDMTAALQSTGYTEGTISGGAAVTAGTEYYLGIVTSFTGTTPLISGNSGSPNFPFNIRGFYPSIFLTGQATVPASFTPSAASLNSGSYFFTAGT